MAVREDTISPVPVREYAGHTADILAIAWSPSDLILSASCDGSVRLWSAFLVHLQLSVRACVCG